jgi:peroxin-6
VFIIGATNRPDLLDKALLRPGNLDRLVYLGVSETPQEQLPILKALTRKFNLHDDVDMLEIAERCSGTFTGADFYALCSDAILNAIKERIDLLEILRKQSNPELAKDIQILENEKLIVEKKHFFWALEKITPSVSAEELKRYKQVQELFS